MANFRTFFASPLVKKSSLQQSEQREEDIVLSRAVSQERERKPELALGSIAQQRIWIFDQLMPNNHLYNLPLALHLTGRLDIAALEKGLNEIIQRHEILRTIFILQDEQPIQNILPSLQLALSLQDLQSVPVAERETRVQQIIAQEMQYHFDLSHGPLLRGKLLRLREDEHILVLIIHQIIWDQQSQRIFLRELATFYQSYASGQLSPVPAPVTQYRDFAREQSKWLASEELQSQLAYWQRQLDDLPSVLQLPTDRPRPAMQSFKGAHITFKLPNTMTTALKTLSQHENVTLLTALIAAVNILLFRYTGQDDLPIGMPSTYRVRAEQETLIGPFFNTLVIRTLISDNPTFRELLGQVRATVLAAHTHQNLPFEQLVEKLQHERDFSHNPLFQVMVAMEDEPAEIEGMPGIVARLLQVEHKPTPLDIAFTFQESAGELHGRLEYCTDLFDASTISRMIGHLQTLLEAIVANPDQSIGELPLLTATERQQQLIDWNDTRMDYPREACIHTLFETQVERTPANIAVIFEDRQLTYRELNRRANQLANYLRQLGVGPEVLVGLCVERSLEMVIGVLGILKAGGAYVPLDPTYPTDRIAYMLESSEAPVLVTQLPLTKSLPTRGLKVVCLDSDISIIEQQSDTNLEASGNPENLAYVIYTSGSTGRPKGVQISHRAVVNLLTSVGQQPGMTAEDTLLAVATLSFDIAGFDLYMPLITGARSVIASQQVLADGNQLSMLLERHQVTVMQATPVTWRIFLASGWQGNSRLKVICTGEALPLSLAQQLLPRVASLWNMYGPTETTIWSSRCKIEPGDDTITIGRPLGNTHLYILDKRLQLLPVGVPGELYIGGDGLARGYLKRPDLTAERFICHHFSNTREERLYKTGDLARYRADGSIEVSGRLDHQVKVRGFRIELGEIETALGKHPAVKQCVAVVQEDTLENKRIVAYVVGKQPSSLAINDLRQCLKEQLPDYMQPSTFVMLEQFPLTPNGKVDRKALPLAGNNTKREEAIVPPVTPTEQRLAGIATTLLHLEQISIDDNFFLIGGNSLIATQFIARIAENFGVKLPSRTLFNTPTIRQLATEIERIMPDHVEQTPEGEHITHQQAAVEIANPLERIVAIQTGGTRRPFFFLHGQWTGDAFYCYGLAQRMGPDQPFYLMEPYKLEDVQIPPTIEEIAAAHIQSLQRIQPEGPYLLSGWCNGALIVYEMARQLQAMGQQVDLLVLMEPMTLVYVFHLRLFRTIVHFLGGLAGMREDRRLEAYLKLKQGLKHTYRYIRFRSYRKGVWPRVESAQELRRHYATLFDWSAMGYRPDSVFPGKISFFWSDAQTFRKGWRQIEARGNVEIHYIPGDHTTSRTDNLPVLAEHLQECINEAQAIGEAKHNQELVN